MKKIMFSERYGLEQAVLAGTKTMTRRVITIPEKWHGIEVYGFLHVKGQAALELTDGDGFCIEDQKTGQCAQILPTYRMGEEVAIAQAYQTFRWPALPGIDWKTITDEVTHSKGWKNKMYVKADMMPHRIRITDIKVERLQDIREEDCLREGIVKTDCVAPYSFPVGNGKWKNYRTPQDAFSALIDRISGRGTWQSNPWVYVYTFELIK